MIMSKFIIEILYLMKVTGANKGIGYAVVRGLCKQFDGDVFLTGNRPASIWIERHFRYCQCVEQTRALPNFTELNRSGALN